MERLLATHETLEDIIKRLAAATKRPVYAIAPYAHHVGGDTKYHVPGEIGYREMGVLEIYLARLEGTEQCVSTEEMSNEDKARWTQPPRGWRLFDLRATSRYQLVFPITADDKTKRGKYDAPFDYDIFKQAGISCFGASEVETIFPSRLDLGRIPEDLRPFIREYRLYRGSRNEMSQGIRFARSEVIIAPQHVRKKWHVGIVSKDFVSLQSPGRYASRDPISVMSDFNRFGATECDPGPCVVCRGKSGERRHFVALAPGGEGSGAWASNHVCRTCTTDTFAQIQVLLDGKEPLRGLVEPEKT